jgi:hypothetical protein
VQGTKDKLNLVLSRNASFLLQIGLYHNESSLTLKNEQDGFFCLEWNPVNKAGVGQGNSVRFPPRGKAPLGKTKWGRKGKNEERKTWPGSKRNGRKFQVTKDDSRRIFAEKAIFKINLIDIAERERLWILDKTPYPPDNALIPRKIL